LAKLLILLSLFFVFLAKAFAHARMRLPGKCKAQHGCPLCTPSQ
jgi:hypothetical protein